MKPTLIVFRAVTVVAFLTQFAQGQGLQSQYINPNGLPANVKNYLGALGDRIQKPGNERTILVGTYTDGTGTTQAQVTWQAPGSVRLDRANQPGQPLIYSAVKAAVAVPLQAVDSNVLESFLDDTAEAFFYGFQGGASFRLLGQRFRSDDGRSLNYQGPWYDVYAGVGSAKGQIGNPSRIKHYYFDSQTGLLARTRYLSSPSVTVSTEFSNWTKIGAQSFPGQIARTENGTVVFRFSTNSASTAPAVSDATFAVQ